MGGLTSLMLAHLHPDRILSFTNIEGNIAPEDCFLSRQIIEYPAANAHEFFERFIEHTLYTPAYSSPLYSASLSGGVMRFGAEGEGFGWFGRCGRKQVSHKAKSRCALGTRALRASIIVVRGKVFRGSGCFAGCNTGGLVMVGGAVAHPAATPEPRWTLF